MFLRWGLELVCICGLLPIAKLVFLYVFRFAANVVIGCGGLIRLSTYVTR